MKLEAYDKDEVRGKLLFVTKLITFFNVINPKHFVGIKLKNL